MAMMHEDLLSYYERIFAYKQFHQWNLDEYYDMFPWEVDVMSTLIANYLETLELQRKQARGISGS